MTKAHYARKEDHWKAVERRRKNKDIKNFIIYFLFFFVFLGLLTYLGYIFKTAIIAVYYGIISGSDLITSLNYCSFRQSILNADWFKLGIKAVIMALILVYSQHKNYKIYQFVGGILAFVALFILLEMLDWFAYLIKFLFIAAWTGITTFKWEITIKNILMDYNIDFLSRFGQVSILYVLMKYLYG